MLWHESLECGISSIDKQHREMVRQIEVLMDTNNTERIDSTLAFLADYVVRHFATEEVMHLQSNYPKAAHHRTAHQQFAQTFRHLKAEYESSPNQLTTIIRINKAVMSWLREHIMGEDKDFAKYYKAVQGAAKQ